MSVNTYLPGVIAIPSALLITAISRSYPMIISVSVPALTASDTYQAGQLIKLVVPKPYGMFQANGLTAQVIEHSANQITVDIDSRGFDAFVTPSGNVEQPASVSPSGSRNLQYNNSTSLVPFQSLNNAGN